MWVVKWFSLVWLFYLTRPRHRLMAEVEGEESARANFRSARFASRRAATVLWTSLNALTLKGVSGDARRQNSFVPYFHVSSKSFDDLTPILMIGKLLNNYYLVVLCICQLQRQIGNRRFPTEDSYDTILLITMNSHRIEILLLKDNVHAHGRC